ncbi:uncharacterized protein BCR38DRAFT_457708 [Pseudomassariella vexata]|uniref:F-box domain-containing protein n=1 Tax=Pseudomassariella vexata TaxID=1141098 RepID=A0A1Y2DXM2_9PEZI|nr:uncharacterized protein BCR38DRAFT_457708 [Pseudomassariella vexata]ORY63864.1 hypothetical protein BCR38DRAFT_457708 [Pseudomassariella vexata]
MASGDIQEHTRDLSESSELNLLDLLSNTLVLQQTVPYLPPSALLSIAATSKQFRKLFLKTPGVFRHLDLTCVKTAQFNIAPIDNGGETWRNVQLDENLTEDDFYSGPLRGIAHNLQRGGILKDVHTLVLDGLSVTAELVHDILVDPSYNVRILSIREAKNLNERKLMQSLSYACRRTRPDGSPKLRGLYVFGKRDMPASALASTRTPSAASTPSVRSSEIGINWNRKSSNTLYAGLCTEQDDWYEKRGRIISSPIAHGWAKILLECRDAICFDAVLCTGPRHANSAAYGRVPVSPVPGVTNPQLWNVATFAMSGCATCGSAPEGFTVYGDSATEELPLLAPVPLHSSNVKAASIPNSASSGAADAEKPRFVPRCWDCIRDRYCFSCEQWWCEACYQVPSSSELNSHTRKITRSCWECENNCLDCIAHTQRRCKSCGGGYCIIHYDGSTMTLCDWCSTRGRRIRELY